MKNRAAAIVGEDLVYIPHLDSAFRLDNDGADDLSAFLPPPRLDPSQTGHCDWHNDYQKLVQDLQVELSAAADDKERRVIVRKIRSALEN